MLGTFKHMADPLRPALRFLAPLTDDTGWYEVTGMSEPERRQARRADTSGVGLEDLRCL